MRLRVSTIPSRNVSACIRSNKRWTRSSRMTKMRRMALIIWGSKVEMAGEEVPDHLSTEHLQ